MGTINDSTAIWIFKKNGVIPALTKEELAELLQKHPELKEIFIDATERPIQRKQDYEQQKKEYSGKKKRHTMKNLIIAGDNNMILGLWKTEVGSKHDYILLKESGFMEVLLKYVIRLDLWFYGVKKDYPEHNTMIPHKNSKCKKLNTEQKEENRIMASVRVIIENIIGWAKKYWIIANRYRNRTTWDFRTVKINMKHKIMLTVCWLYNLSKSSNFTA